jgi:hypothetical protein
LGHFARLGGELPRSPFAHQPGNGSALLAAVDCSDWSATERAEFIHFWRLCSAFRLKHSQYPASVRLILEHRNRFRGGSVLDLACLAYGQMCRHQSFDATTLFPLQEILHVKELVRDVSTNLASALAKLSAMHPNSSVRILAHHNLQQILALVAIEQPINPTATTEERKRQWERWHNDWLRITPRLVLNEAVQMVVRQAEIPGQPD